MTLPKPMTFGAKSEGRFGKQYFVFLPDESLPCWRARLKYRMTTEEQGKTMRRYWTTACCLSAQTEMHNRLGTKDSAMGTRAYSMLCSSGSRPASHAPPPRNR